MTDRGKGLIAVSVISVLIWLIIVVTVKGCSASEIDLDKWADAIRKAEGNANYGIVSIKCNPKTDECRRYCKNTVYNTLVKYRSTRCRPDEDDLTCLARRYCPINSDTDNGTCINWGPNVSYFLEND